MGPLSLNLCDAMPDARPGGGGVARGGVVSGMARRSLTIHRTGSIKVSLHQIPVSKVLFTRSRCKQIVMSTRELHTKDIFTSKICINQ